MASIVLPHTAEVEAIRDIVAKARKDFGNLRAAMYREPGGWRWRSVMAFGIVKTDAITLHDTTLPASSVTPTGNKLWLPCKNLAIHHPHLDRAELARIVMRRWSGSKRMTVQPFEAHQSAAGNAAEIVRFSLEQSGQLGFDDTGGQWPAPWRAEFHSWLFGMQRGLQPLGISSRPQRNRDVLHA
jgi:hypothetical protein